MVRGCGIVGTLGSNNEVTMDQQDYSAAMERLVGVVRGHGICDAAILGALERVPRHVFIPEALRGGVDPYGDYPCQGTARYPKKSHQHLLSGRTRTYEFIKSHAQEYVVGTMCDTFGICRSAYYRWAQVGTQ